MKKNTDANPEGKSSTHGEAVGEDAVPTEISSESAASSGPGKESEPEDKKGLRWLKYSGIGSRRNAKSGDVSEGLSGDAITSLGSLEAEVMAAVWDIGHPVTGMEVMEHSLYKRRARGEEPVGFATISTTLRRLTQKGLLRSEKTTQRTPVYAPMVGREEMAARVLNNVSETLLGRSLYTLLPRLTGSHSANTEPSALRKPARGTAVAPASSHPEGIPASFPDDVAIDDLLRALEMLAEAEGSEGPGEA